MEDGVAFCDIIDAVGRKQTAKFINEGNVYRLILRSKLPTAMAFEKWVVETVLPTIRKTGAYFTPQTLEQLLTNPDRAPQLFHELKQLTDEIAVLQPKAAYYNALVDKNVLTGIRQTAKELRIPEKLFTYLLVEMGFVYRTPKRLLSLACNQKKGEHGMEQTKNLCAQIPVDLHAKVCAEKDEVGKTMSQYITEVLTKYYEGGNITMEKSRTLAFQISEELYQRIKNHLARESNRTGVKLTQRDFVLTLIEQALNGTEVEKELKSTD